MRLTLLVALSLTLACGSDGGESRGDTDATAATPATASTATTTASTPTTTDEGTTNTSAGSAAATSSTGTTTAEPTTTAGLDDSTTLAASTGQLTDSSTGEPKLDFPPPEPIPVHEIPGLVSITFYESTSGVDEYTFLVDGPELSGLLPHPLTSENKDIQGTEVEFYDVYYSDQDGVFDPDGSYLTIAGSFPAKLPAGGGLNLAEISLNYEGNTYEFGSFLASFQGLGDNYVAGSEPNAIDGDLMTHTTMGNNADEPEKRLRVTLGFKSSLMPG